jgi:hypothetical protein
MRSDANGHAISCLLQSFSLFPVEEFHSPSVQLICFLPYRFLEFYYG